MRACGAEVLFSRLECDGFGGVIEPLPCPFFVVHDVPDVEACDGGTVGRRG